MGENLFQFKFKTEFDMERTIHDGPWTFDNQLLLVQKWHRGMTAKNVNLDLASLWIQIWDAPFDMVSPTVAKEVGGRLGKVEEVERRRNPDDQNIFMRVKVVLPILNRLGGGLIYLVQMVNEHGAISNMRGCHFSVIIVVYLGTIFGIAWNILLQQNKMKM